MASSYNIQPPQSSHPRGSTAPEASIPDLREALSTLESKMASLMNERERLERSLEQAVRLQAPIQRLPSELLASIFTIGVLGTEEEDSLMLSNVVLVCRYWADVAMNTPVLWSRIVVSNHVSLDKARLRLSRSKSVPLHVDINFSPQMDGRGGTTETIIHAMDILYPSTWRWKSFYLSVPTRAQAHAALARCKEKAPLLQVLQVRVFNSMQDDHYSPPPLPLFEGHFPRLEVCSFNSFNFGWDLSMVRGMRVLELGGYWNNFAPAVNVILDVLRASPQLEELSLRNMSDVDPETCAMYQHEPHLDKRFPSHMIQLPRLTKMTFHYAGIQRTRTILSQFAFPALEKVAFCYMDNVTSLLNHLKRQSLTSLPLHHLRIEASFFGELELVKLLTRTSSLTTLELVDVEDASSSLIKVRASISVYIQPKLNNPHALTEPFRSNRDHDLDLPKTGDAEPRWVHDARLGRAADLRRIASARARPRVPTASRTANVDLTRTNFLLCARHHHHHRLGHRHNDGIINNAASAAPDARAGAPNPARALTLCPSKRVEFLVAAAAEELGPDAVSSDRKGDGAVVEVVCRRGQMRNLHARQRIVARIVNFYSFFFPFFLFFFNSCQPIKQPPFHLSFFPLAPKTPN